MSKGIYNRRELASLICAHLEKNAERCKEMFLKNDKRFFYIDSLLPESIVKNIYRSFPSPESMHLRKSLKERKHVAAQMDKYNNVLEEIVFSFQDPGVVKIIEKITDIEGNLVAEAQSNINSRYRNFNLEIDGGTAFWNGKNLRNRLVASGVYIIMLSDLDSYETKVLKLMIVR